MADTNLRFFLQALQSAYAPNESWHKTAPSSPYRFEVLGVGDFHPDFRITAHAHPCYEVGLGLDGRGNLSFGIEDHAVDPGDIFIIEPHTSHRLAAVDDLPFSCLIFHIYCEARSVDGTGGALPGIHHSKVVEGKELIALVRSWAEMNRVRYVDPVSLSLFSRCLVYEMLSLLGDGGVFREWTLVDRAKIFFERNLPEKVDIPTAAAELGVSERTLRRHFQNELGMSVIEYVNDRRVGLAQSYLALHLSVQDIARKVGFRSSGQLSRLFQKRTGMTPKAWQQSRAPTRRIPKTSKALQQSRNSTDRIPKTSLPLPDRSLPLNLLNLE